MALLGGAWLLAGRVLLLNQATARRWAHSPAPAALPAHTVCPSCCRQALCPLSISKPAVPPSGTGCCRHCPLNVSQKVEPRRAARRLVLASPALEWVLLS